MFLAFYLQSKIVTFFHATIYFNLNLIIKKRAINLYEKRNRTIAISVIGTKWEN